VDLIKYLPELLTFLGGGTVLQLFNMWKEKRVEKREDKIEGRNDFETLIEQYKEDNLRLREEVAAMRDEIKEMAAEQRKDKQEIHNLSLKLQLMESAHYDLPIPAWLKDTNGTMLSLNAAYEELFIVPLGKKIEDYVGKTDSEFWGEEIGKEYLLNDLKILRQGKSEIVTETVVMANGEKSQWMILKYPRMAGNTKIGIAGIAFKEMNVGESV